MLIPNDKLWESDRILMVQNTTDWEKGDASVMTDCALNMVKTHLEEASLAGDGLILIIDLTCGDFPPWTQVLRIVKFFVTMRSLLISGLTCTVIYANTSNQKTWIDRVLNLYSHARPVHVVETKESIKDIVAGYRKPVEAHAR